MERKIIVISVEEFLYFLHPLSQRLEKIEKLLSTKSNSIESIYTDTQAAKFLKMSTKKLQHLRNARKSGFIHVDGGRKIAYTHE